MRYILRVNEYRGISVDINQYIDPGWVNHRPLPQKEPAPRKAMVG